MKIEEKKYLEIVIFYIKKNLFIQYVICFLFILFKLFLLLLLHFFVCYFDFYLNHKSSTLLSAIFIQHKGLETCFY